MERILSYFSSDPGALATILAALIGAIASIIVALLRSHPQTVQELLKTMIVALKMMIGVVIIIAVGSMAIIGITSYFRLQSNIPQNNPQTIQTVETVPILQKGVALTISFDPSSVSQPLVKIGEGLQGIKVNYSGGFINGGVGWQTLNGAGEWYQGIRPPKGGVPGATDPKYAYCLLLKIGRTDNWIPFEKPNNLSVRGKEGEIIYGTINDGRDWLYDNQIDPSKEQPEIILTGY